MVVLARFASRSNAGPMRAMPCASAPFILMDSSSTEAWSSASLAGCDAAGSRGAIDGDAPRAACASASTSE